VTKPTVANIDGFIIGECFGGLTEMRWLLVILVIVMLLGPFRRWIGRHWAFLLSVIAGAAFGFFLGTWVINTCGSPFPGLPLLWALVGAIAAGRVGPKVLRDIERDGKNDQSSRRH
jgi:hypothetical protein